MKNFKRLVSLILAFVMLICMTPLTIFAAPASDIPADMLDNVYLDALEYTGYKVQTQKNDGTIFKKYSNSAPASVRSNISYGTGPSGLETVSNSGTATGLAPNIAKFEQSGLCCASYVSYVYYNYLPNIAGIDTSGTPAPSNPRAAVAYKNAAESWISSGIARSIPFTQNSDGSGFSSTETIPIGSLIAFKNISSGTIAHVAIYAGYYNGNHFITHVGNDNGPEFCTISGMSKGGSPQVVALISAPEFVESNGAIEVYKKDTDGKSLAGAVFVATNDTTGTQYKIGPTNANGYAISDDAVPYGSYTVKETVFPTNYRSYGQTEWKVTVSSANNGKVTFNAVNEIIPGNIKIVKSSEDNKISGFEFNISGNGVNKNVTTNSSGEIAVNDLKPGTYTVSEKVYDAYVPQSSQTVTVVSGQTASVYFNNELRRGNLTVTKTAEDGLAEGLQFGLTGTSLSGERVDMYAVSDNNGKVYFKDIPIGKYKVFEYQTPDRYVEPEDLDVTIEWNKTSEENIHNALKKWRVEVYKSDLELVPQIVPMSLDNTNDYYGVSQGDATLEGAVYGLYKGNKLIDTYTTDKNGYFITDYYPCGYDYYLQEITPSEGYLLDETKYDLGTFPEWYRVEYNTINSDVFEQIKKGVISIVKHTDDGSTKIETPEVGAEFEIFLKSSGSYDKAKETERDLLVINKHGFAVTKELPYGVYTVKQIKGWEGKEFIPDFDVFVRDNGELYNFIINNATYEALIEIEKRDAESGKLIPVSGVGFRVRNTDTGEYIVQRVNYPTPTDIEVYYTDNSGKLMLPEKLPYGNYEIIEECTAYGYVLDTTPVPFKVDGSKTVVTVEKHNMAQKGTITVNKTGEVFWSVTEEDGMYQPVYKESGLEGAVFSVIAAEEISTPDGTVRYSKGEIVDTITTDAEGIAVTKLLYLGKYEIRETKAPYGMIKNDEVYTAELVYAGQEISITSASVSVTNKRQKAEISLSKILEKDENFKIGDNDEILSVQFGVYAACDLVSKDGSIIPTDGLIETAYCDEDGNITFTTDIPVGARLYIKEIATDDRYIISEEKYFLEFGYQGEDVTTVSLSVLGGQKIENALKRGTVIGYKVDEDGFAIEGAVFGIFKPDETEFSEDTAIMTATSDEIGEFAFENVPYGNWILREIKAAPAFVLNTENYAVNITEHEQVVEIIIENRYIVGSVKVTKTDADYPENKLTGAVFEAYVDADRNKEYDPEIDLLVDELTETEKGIYRLENLRYNGYFLHEKSAPEGFIKDDGYYYFEIKNDGEIVNVETEAGKGFINKPIKGELVILKTDKDSGEPIEGVGFRVKDTKGNIVAEDYTNAEGIVKFTLRYGKYTYEEFKTPYNYKADSTVYECEITDNGMMVYAEVKNEKMPVPTAPKTGDNTKIGFWLGLAAVALGGLIACGIIKLKNKNGNYDDDED